MSHASASHKTFSLLSRDADPGGFLWLPAPSASRKVMVGWFTTTLSAAENRRNSAPDPWHLNQVPLTEDPLTCLMIE